MPILSRIDNQFESILILFTLTGYYLFTHLHFNILLELIDLCKVQQMGITDKQQF